MRKRVEAPALENPAGLRQNISRDAQCELEEGLVEHLLCEVRALTVGEAAGVECVAMVVGAALDEIIGTLLRSDAWCVGASDKYHRRC